MTSLALVMTKKIKLNIVVFEIMQTVSSDAFATGNVAGLVILCIKRGKPNTLNGVSRTG